MTIQGPMSPDQMQMPMTTENVTDTDKVSAEMPSNIALIKYMGKVQGQDRNRPTNSSLSYTLNKLRSRVEIVPVEDHYDVWSTIEEQGWIPTALSDRGRKRFLAHFEFLKQKLNINGHFHIRSANNFPSDCGIASSASSFAALTQAAYNLAHLQNPKIDISLTRLADLSRVASGSSIRSFMAPFVMWSAEGIQVVETPYHNLQHRVVIVDHSKKLIGSSDAHQRVPSSLLFTGRPQRAGLRLQELLTAFKNQDWSACFEIVWSEFWDMHALFTTSRPPFGYMSDASFKVLDCVFNYWQTHKDGPLVTMDAGANVHFIFRADQSAHIIDIENQLKKMFESQHSGFKIL